MIWGMNHKVKKSFEQALNHEPTTTYITDSKSIQCEIELQLDCPSVTQRDVVITFAAEVRF